MTESSSIKCLEIPYRLIFLLDHLTFPIQNATSATIRNVHHYREIRKYRYAPICTSYIRQYSMTMSSIKSCNPNPVRRRLIQRFSIDPSPVVSSSVADAASQCTSPWLMAIVLSVMKAAIALIRSSSHSVPACSVSAFYSSH